MKLLFEPDLDFQKAAIDAVCDLFIGQQQSSSPFTVRAHQGVNPALSFDDGGDLGEGRGFGNKLTLLDTEIAANLQAVQLRNGLAQQSGLPGSDFTVELETGTGKTYVYLRTILELHKRYGFSKYVIVVPSVAIKEGVYKTLQMTEEHFKALYEGQSTNYFLYDSSKINQVRNFAVSNNIQVMVMTVGAINKKDVNNLYKVHEAVSGAAPIDLIAGCNPIVIVDEPQSVEGGLEGRGKEALGRMNPLCTLRYSATPAEKYQMVYRLDAVDAYQRKLVKQIEVAAAHIEGGHNTPYVRLHSVTSKSGRLLAKASLDVNSTVGVSRREVTLQDGDDLQQISGGRAVYADMRVGELRAGRTESLMELHVPGDVHYLAPGHEYGGLAANALQRQMIKRTIKEHLDKEKRLRPLGIKVLSLFFIDIVEKYRAYDQDGNPQKGDYARIFEEEYRALAGHPDYRTLFEEVDLDHAAEAVHAGYFSIDRRGLLVNTDEGNQANRDNAERAYNLIMKDKERLLSLDEPLKFIFSHSALKEGWDNPNVFQICALRDMGSLQERRQTIGRGLRLCVGADGVRVRNDQINLLTVIANESYEEFAAGLQREIEQETGIRFGVVQSHEFAAVLLHDLDNPAAPAPPLGQEGSEEVRTYLQAGGYLTAAGKVTDTLRTALKQDTLTLPADFEGAAPQILDILRKLCGGLEVKNRADRVPVPTRQAVLDGPDFKALWERIKTRTTYRVEFDNGKMVLACIKALQQAPAVARTSLEWRRAGVGIGKEGVTTTPIGISNRVSVQETRLPLPDVLTELQNRTELTRRSLAEILLESKRLDDFELNPQQFIEYAAHVINREKRLALVDGIKYEKLPGSGGYYAQELFVNEQLTGYLTNMLEVNKGVHEQVVYDSDVEKSFAQDLDATEGVKVFAKLPGWFTVPTPLGNYNPDWAVLIEQDDGERLYLVAETKSTLFAHDIRATEEGKVKCGEKHFEALHDFGESSVQFRKATKVSDLYG